MSMMSRVACVFLALSGVAVAFNPLAMLQSGLHALQPEGVREGGLEESSRKAGVGATEATNVTQRVVYYARSTTENSVLGSLFELGVQGIEDDTSNVEEDQRLTEVKQKMKEGQENKPVNKISQFSELLSEMKNLPFLPLVEDPQGGMEGGANGVGDDNALTRYLDAIRGDAWGQFKSLALSYTNWLEHEYQLQEITSQLPLDLVKKVLDLGDRVNFLHVVGKRVDPGLAEYLADQLQPLFKRFQAVSSSRMFQGGLPAVLNGIVRDAAWKTMHQFVGHVLKVAERTVSKEDLRQFQTDLAKSSPLVAKGLAFVLGGRSALEPVAEGRSMSTRGGYRDYDYGYDSGYDGGYGGLGGYSGSSGHSSGGYGGYGSYDESYGMSHGYGYGVYLDSYLILGGIGAAALLAFLAYRLIVTTARRRRSLDDLTLIDLSDMPNIVHNLYNMIDAAERRYDQQYEQEHDQQDDSDDLAEGLNSLWREHVGDGCVRCQLFKFAREHFTQGLNLADSLAIAGVAHMLGGDRSGQLLDEVSGHMLDGRDVTCRPAANTCHVK